MPTNNWFYSESAGYFSNTLSNSNLPNANTQYRTASLCSEYSYGVDVEHCFWIDSSGKGLRVKDSRFTTVTEFQKYLNDNRVSVIYPLAEPVKTDLSESFDNILEVEAGGSLEFVNEYKNAVPISIDATIGRIAHLELEHQDIINNMVTKEKLQAYIDDAILNGEW
jgi:hypothetical protein